ncbi:MAG: SAM-dependent DNA methyltransferase [Bacteroidetes bacterium]|nr:MAG: SAM-dependent DNA methyltransferase [Bacteroidota bacterium]
MNHHQITNFIWQIADLLRGPYRPPQYERVMLPMTVLRRFDCVLQPTKAKVLAEYERLKDRLQGPALDSRLNSIAGANFRFHNHSKLDFEKLKGDPDNIAIQLNDYINGFSENVRLIFERFEFDREIDQMNRHNILYLVVSKFCDVDLHPNRVDNIAMGSLFENLIRRFNEAANETAGDHFTPREVIQLMVDVLFLPDNDILTKVGKVFTLLDPTCGTGGMLSEAQSHLGKMNPDAKLIVYGQDFNPRSYAIAESDLLLKIGTDGESPSKSVISPQSKIEFGDSLTDDKYSDKKFDYFLANPPFGVDWKAQRAKIVEEHEQLGFRGRFGAGYPRVNDGSLLFLQHMVSKFEDIDPNQNKNGSRLAIVFNGSPLFTGGPGSGESEIRKWLIENDMIEAIIALPEAMFYNTGIGTYIWVVTNRKDEQRQGHIQLIDARERFHPMRRNLGDKRREMTDEDIEIIVCEYGAFEETATSKIFHNTEFGYKEIQIERPLRLVYQMDVERKSNFLNAYPELLDDVQAIDQRLGREARGDWNEFDQLMTDLLKQRGSKWAKKPMTDFRGVFTFTDPQAEPVIAKVRRAKNELYARVWGWFPQGNREVMYEPDTELRDRDNVPLRYGGGNISQRSADDEAHSEIIQYFQEEVQPHAQDAWADREKVRGAYEINFNRYFYEFEPPPSLEEIDSKIKLAQEKLLRLLSEVIE